MKRLFILFFIVVHCLAGMAQGGIPFFSNYTSDIYKAHNRNFDIVCDDYGTVYVANFEGVLYYDQAQWRVIHTPGISRVTSLYKAHDGRIWVGGYNVFGYLDANERGMLRLHVLHSDTSNNLLGEILSIDERSGYIHFYTSDNQSYVVLGDKIKKMPSVAGRDSKSGKSTAEVKHNQMLELSNRYRLFATTGRGLLIEGNNKAAVYSLSEQNGLCNNNINHIAYNNKGGIWGATDDGLFCAGMPSVFTHFTATEGLKGEVTAINSVGQTLYVGTMQGLYIKSGRHFTPIPTVSQACWQFDKSPNGSLYAATSDGLFVVNGFSATRINRNHTLSVLFTDATHFYTGELDGLYLNTRSGLRTKVANIEKVKNIIRDRQGAIWVETVYGQAYVKTPADRQFVNVATKARLRQDDILTLFNNKGDIGILNHQGLLTWCDKGRCFKLTAIPRKEHFDNYPQFIYFDPQGRVWQTDSEGHSLGVAINNRRATEYDSWLNPLRDLTINAMNVSDRDIWIGGNFGLIHWDLSYPDIEYRQRSTVYIRSISLDNDSVIWGGYSHIGPVLKPQILTDDVSLSSDSRNISFTFSTDRTSIFGKTEYRYRLKGYNDWSAWTTETSAHFENLWYGSYEFQVMARDKYKRITPTAVFSFSIQYPLYLRWYSFGLYILLFVGFILMVIRLRMRRLLKEKMHLEKIVEERTSELRQRNEEVEEKSHSLEKALNDLGNAQDKLIHQEKMATVGKLTKGLIDRILNPMNYINNFSHLSKGLIKDIEDDIEDDKDKMTPDNYDDAKDVLSMVDSNLEKIEQHGMNTARILKAMEEMLKDRRGKKQEISLAAMCTRIFDVSNSRHAENIKKYGIRTEMMNCPDTVKINANEEQLSKTLFSLIDNGIYALIKKYNHHPFEPEMTFRVEKADANTVRLTIHDNGIGIESTIIDNIFDPFFTTKTTGEAAGVGLYLSREIVLDHGGTITVRSEKDQYTEFIITLPLKDKEAQ